MEFFKDYRLLVQINYVSREKNNQQSFLVKRLKNEEHNEILFKQITLSDCRTENFFWMARWDKQGRAAAPCKHERRAAEPSQRNSEQPQYTHFLPPNEADSALWFLSALVMSNQSGQSPMREIKTWRDGSFRDNSRQARRATPVKAQGCCKLQKQCAVLPQDWLLHDGITLEEKFSESTHLTAREGSIRCHFGKWLILWVWETKQWSVELNLGLWVTRSVSLPQMNKYFLYILI